ncbi:MAG TPA: hypothetical protein VGR91_04730 [Stellaceae bacterium]|nr:hypothetical protein [Stellaceae bacterium]
MKKLAVLVIALAVFGTAPRAASAQEASSSPGSVVKAAAAIVVGAAVGGAVGYYYFTGRVATIIGVLAGGAIGEYWYAAATSNDMAMPGGKMRFSGKPMPKFQRISDIDSGRPALRLAPFSANGG